MSINTRKEFYEKYKDVDFYLQSYNKYSFQFKGEYEGCSVCIEVGGNSTDIYSEEFYIDCAERIESLQPYSGSCGDDSFYDY